MRALAPVELPEPQEIVDVRGVETARDPQIPPRPLSASSYCGPMPAPKVKVLGFIVDELDGLPAELDGFPEVRLVIRSLRLLKELPRALASVLPRWGVGTLRGRRRDLIHCYLGGLLFDDVGEVREGFTHPRENEGELLLQRRILDAMEAVPVVAKTSFSGMHA